MHMSYLNDKNRLTVLYMMSVALHNNRITPGTFAWTVTLFTFIQDLNGSPISRSTDYTRASIVFLSPSRRMTVWCLKL
jgi:hypothetical protein